MLLANAKLKGTPDKIFMYYTVDMLILGDTHIANEPALQVQQV